MGLGRMARKLIDRNRRSRKGISTIMANLTMLIIVVVLSSILFVWAVSSFGAYQGGAGYWFSSRSIANQERMSIEGTYFYTASSTNYALVYVRNVGTIPITIASVYVNQTLYVISPGLVITVNNVTAINGPNGLCMTCISQPLNHGSYTITVATTRGTVVTTTTVY
ncbi:MAG TPA: hypothetical protein VFV92_11195 [Candidatus Bathyarchaeia archaeon]|nr:hypothetical protein [Candidatus Bathyarchaeia archaeon]